TTAARNAWGAGNQISLRMQTDASPGTASATAGVQFSSREQAAAQLSINYTIPNYAPNAPSLSGPSSTSGGSYNVNWNFSDPNPGDTEYAWQYQIARDAGFTNIAGDTGKQLSAATSFTEGRDEGGTWYHRVRVWDNHDVVSAWSNTVTTVVNHAPHAP